MIGPTRKGSFPTRRGFALLSALWLMVMLSGVGLHIAVRARADRLAAANRSEGVQVRAGADAGVAHAMARLADRLRPPISSRDGDAIAVRHPWFALALILPETTSLDAVRYAVRLRDANASVQLNLASVDDLRGLMIALRVDAGVADRVAQAIADWRDSDDLRHARGAERVDYVAAEARALPRNGSFVRIEELRDVREVSDELYRIVRPFLTLAGSGRINPNTAAEPVLLSLPGFTPDVVDALMRLRTSGVLLSSPDQLLAAMPSGVRNRMADRSAEWLPRLIFETSELEFESEAWMERSPVRETVRGTFVRAGGMILTTDRRAE